MARLHRHYHRIRTELYGLKHSDVVVDARRIFKTEPPDDNEPSSTRWFEVLGTFTSLVVK